MSLTSTTSSTTKDKSLLSSKTENIQVEPSGCIKTKCDEKTGADLPLHGNSPPSSTDALLDASWIGMIVDQFNLFRHVVYRFEYAAGSEYFEFQLRSQDTSH